MKTYTITKTPHIGKYLAFLGEDIYTSTDQNLYKNGECIYTISSPYSGCYGVSANEGVLYAVLGCGIMGELDNRCLLKLSDNTSTHFRGSFHSAIAQISCEVCRCNMHIRLHFNIGMSYYKSEWEDVTDCYSINVGENLNSIEYIGSHRLQHYELNKIYGKILRNSKPVDSLVIYNDVSHGRYKIIHYVFAAETGGYRTHVACVVEETTEYQIIHDIEIPAMTSIVGHNGSIYACTANNAIFKLDFMCLYKEQIRQFLLVNKRRQLVCRDIEKIIVDYIWH